MIVLILIAAIVLAAHLLFLRHAGGLWRDEANSAAFAGMRSLAEIWSSLRYDSVPIVSTLVFHGWTVLGLGSDAGLRVLGFVIGGSIVAALWLTARMNGAPMPGASILLLATSPVLVRYGDAIRPTGLGVLFIVLTLGVFWKTLREPRPIRIAVTLLAAVLSVHTLYHNAFLLAGICTAGALAMLLQGEMRKAALAALVMLAAGLSLVIYLPAIRIARGWVPLVQSPLNLRSLWGAVASPARVDAWIWVILAVAGLGAAAFAIARRSRAPDSDPWLTSAFAALTIVASTGLFLGFLHRLRVGTQPWYYLPLLAVVASSLDLMAGPLLARPAARRIVIFVLLAATILHFGAARGDLAIRQTNVDLVARRLNASVAREDLVVVFPLYVATTFTRYYRGPAPWSTVPPLEDTRILNYELVRRRMLTRGAVDPLASDIRGTLRRGNRVWFVGGFPTLAAGEIPEDPAPAPSARFGWSVDAFEFQWGKQLVAVLQGAGAAERIDVPSPDAVNPMEEVPLNVFRGWR